MVIGTTRVCPEGIIHYGYQLCIQDCYANYWESVCFTKMMPFLYLKRFPVKEVK